MYLINILNFYRKPSSGNTQYLKEKYFLLYMENSGHFLYRDLNPYHPPHAPGLKESLMRWILCLKVNKTVTLPTFFWMCISCALIFKDFLYLFIIVIFKDAVAPDYSGMGWEWYGMVIFELCFYFLILI